MRVFILLIVVLWGADLTAVIPLAVLAGIAFKVGVDIIDWRFLKRAHRLSGKGAMITYGVIALTVFVDLIVAVGIGLFVANIMTVTRLSELQEADVKGFTGPENQGQTLSPYENDLFREAPGKVLLLYMRGSMIFGASRAITRKNSELEDCKALVIDLSDVVHLGVSAGLALEEAVLDMLHAGRTVYITGARSQPLARLKDLGIVQRLPAENLMSNRAGALERAFYQG